MALEVRCSMIPAELQRLLQACKDEPDDDSPRLVLADWLEEHGQGERSEFVRLQIRLARQEILAGDEAAAHARLHELYLRHAGEWLGGLHDWPGRCAFRRGLIEVHAGLKALRAQPPQSVAPDAAPWLESLVLEYGGQRAIDDLLGLDALACFSALDVSDVRLKPQWLARLANSPRVAHLRRLRLIVAGSPKAAGGALARSPHLTGLRCLDFVEGIGDSGLEVLVRSPVVRNLSTLALRFHGTQKSIGALAQAVAGPRLTRIVWDYVRTGPALRDLVCSPVLDEIEDLQLDHGDVTVAGVCALAARSDWPRLRRLSLACSPLGREGFEALAGINFRALRSLRLTHTRAQTSGLEALLSAPWVAGLERLELADTTLAEGGAEAIARAPSLANLRHLSFYAGGIAPDGIRALASTPHLSQLHTLDLGSNVLGDVGLAALADTIGLPLLSALLLHARGVTGEGLARLARSSLAARLRRFDLQSSTSLDGKNLQALVSSRLAALQDLRLDSIPVGEDGARALADAPFTGLVRLGLTNTRLGDAGIRALLGTHGFPALVFLSLTGAGVGEEGKTILARWPRCSRACVRGVFAHRDPPELRQRAWSVIGSEGR
jgi:uncharacterized protein (TIGR02996 family)